MHGDEAKGARRSGADGSEPSLSGEGEAKDGPGPSAGGESPTPPDEGVRTFGGCFEPGIPSRAGLDHRCAPTRIGRKEKECKSFESHDA